MSSAKSSASRGVGRSRPPIGCSREMTRSTEASARLRPIRGTDGTVPAAHAAGTAPFLLWFPLSPSGPDGNTLDPRPQMETDERTEREPVAAPSHIIERPRLIKLMEDSGARVIVLHAPAGYGKTTLAREWARSGERQTTWYRCTPAAADIAVLALGLAHSLSRVLPGSGTEVVQRIRASSDPSRTIDRLRELLVEQLDDWPAKAWLVLDDYHNACDSETSEALIEALVSESTVRLVVTSRVRPAWASTRRVLYGEILGVDHQLLSFTSEETRQILPGPSGQLEELAQGWPAILGLAARVENLTPPPSRLPTELYNFLAEELYQETPARLQQQLLAMAIAPALDPESIRVVLGSGPASEDLGECERLGFLQRDRDSSLEMHPLLKSFLIEKVHDSSAEDLGALPRALGLNLLARKRWDEAFSVHLNFPAVGLFLPLLEASLESLIEDGRLDTISRWLEHASTAGLRNPLVDLAAAKLAFRRGDHSRAEILATTAAETLDPEDPAKPGSLITAGQAAMLGDRTSVARNLFERARAAARSTHDRREALIGDFFAALELEHDDAPAILAELEGEQMNPVDARTKLRLSTGRLLYSASFGNLEEAVTEARPLANLVERVDDAYTTTSFLCALSGMSALAGWYSNAVATASEAIGIGQELGLDFAIPHARTLAAAAQMGLREFAEAARTLREVDVWAASAEDAYAAANGRVFRARLCLMQGKAGQALELLSTDPADSYPLGTPG